ncbi:MAG: outer membrane lipoprotein-sorting protein [Treponema sp.]|jgi:hypothetical protein|nr:outer membrane lipoprotein-sorting protein [Treponema sp.]
MKTKTNTFTALAAAFLLLAGRAELSGQTLTGYDIMKRADERYTGDTAQYKLTLASGRAAPRMREVSYYYKDYGDTEKTLMFFNSPRDVAGTGYLSFSCDDESKDDDIWLYLPAMKRVRRITGSGKNDSFMGTVFTYEDMGSRGLNKDEFSLLREEAMDGGPGRVMEARAKDRKDPYGRRVIWIRKDSYLSARYYEDLLPDAYSGGTARPWRKNALTLRMGKSFFRETLSLSAWCYLGLRDFDAAAGASSAWALTDTLSLSPGSDFFSGGIENRGDYAAYRDLSCLWVKGVFRF